MTFSEILPVFNDALEALCRKTTVPSYTIDEKMTLAKLAVQRGLGTYNPDLGYSLDYYLTQVCARRLLYTEASRMCCKPPRARKVDRLPANLLTVE